MAEPTFEGMVKLFDEGQPSMGIFSSEGGRFVFGYGMNEDNKIKTMAGICNIWDGRYISTVRVGSGAKKLYGRRLSLHLMMQPKVASKLLTDASLLDQGFLGRCLLSYPPSLIGQRKYIKENIFQTNSYQLYRHNLTELLKIPPKFQKNDINALNPRILTLTAEAYEYFIDFYEEIEGESSSGGRYIAITSFASKALEHTLRIASCLTLYYDNRAKNISAYWILNAIALMRYYLNEALRLTGDQEIMIDNTNYKQKNELAQELLLWLQNKHNELNGNVLVNTRLVARYAPYKFRNSEVHKPLFDLLHMLGWLKPKSDKSYELVFERIKATMSQTCRR